MKSKITGPVILLSIFLISTSAFAAQYIFTPRVSARETYTDNVFLRDNNTEDDFITDVSAGGTFSILEKTSGMDLSFDPGYRWYADDTKKDTWRLPATLDMPISTKGLVHNHMICKQSIGTGMAPMIFWSAKAERAVF